MKTIKFKCKLLTDVILNQRAATEGNQQSLDFIPGSNFLGIAASSLYLNDIDDVQKKNCWEIFHSGKVRFGDAHPFNVKIDEKDDAVEKAHIRSLRVPASLYKPKLSNREGLYIHHEVTDPENTDFKNFQPKQCRTGFYVFEKANTAENGEVTGCGFEVKVEKSFAIKSAYDREKRRSKDQMMYGYESLLPDSTWIFEVTMDDDMPYEEEIKTALTGKRRIGRSRTAQYGLVEIEEMPDAITDVDTFDISEKDFVLVYADARLIFLDDYGLPTFQPKAEDLGIKGGMIDWEKSQIRTFQYAPWNFKRQARDTDRCGIEKGSVFYVARKSETEKIEYSGNGFVGKYQNEGFGKVVVNPYFLSAKSGVEANGLAAYQLISEKQREKMDITADGMDACSSMREKNLVEAKKEDPRNSDLFKFLKEREKEDGLIQGVYALVNKYVTDHGDKFKDDIFASQWGNIRKIAMQYDKKTDLEKELFTKTKTKNDKIVPDAYLTHGVAEGKWNESKHRENFKEFFDSKSLTDENVQLVLINLAAEMAKICSKK